MLTIHVWPRRLKEFLLTHPLYKSPSFGVFIDCSVDRRPRSINTINKNINTVHNIVDIVDRLSIPFIDINSSC